MGAKAAETLGRMGASVSLVELKRERRRELEKSFRHLGVSCTVLAAEGGWEAELGEADVLIGAVYRSGARAPVLVSRRILSQASRRKKKVIVDVAVDQGGNIFGTHASTYARPVYTDPWGNLRFAVANMPALLGEKSVRELEKVTLDYTLALAEDMPSAFRKYPELKKGIQIWKGKLRSREVAAAHGLPVRLAEGTLR